MLTVNHCYLINITPVLVSLNQAINKKIISLDCGNCKAEIKTVDVQEPYKGGLIIFVTGCLTGKDSVRRKFAETF